MNLLLCAFVSFLFSLFFTRIWILLSKKRGVYQNLREEGPREHLEKKEHVPTMGGIAILLAVFLGTLPVWSKMLWIPLGSFLACGFLGLWDDGLKFFRGKNLGLKARQKLLGQILIGVGLWFFLKKMGIGSEQKIPFWGEWDVGPYFLPLVVFVLIATTNAVNLTDGLDGLASGVTLTTLLFFMLATFLNPVVGFFCASLGGACLGFLWYNAHPAKVFMGDVGSLALGGALCALGFQTGFVFWLPIAGGIFVVETLSVILQVVYFKLTKGKRIFKMSPLHHHFELCGIPENHVTLRFWIASLFLSWFSILGAVHGY
jgi:phospho-N-acetylmuramoyl-pentapeptide-transferase